MLTALPTATALLRRLHSTILTLKKTDRYEFHNVGISGHTVAGGV